MNAPPMTARSTERRIAYPFDAAPKSAREALEQGAITPTDLAVLIELLTFQRAFRGSCWTTKAKIAARLGITPRTVQRSYGRLAEAGLISMRAVGFPDPDEPANRTGWRIHFLFVDGVQPTAPTPDRRPNEDRRKHASNGGGGDTDVSPPRDTDVSQSSKDYVLLDGTELDDDDKMEHPCKQSSSSSSPSDPDRGPDEVDDLFRRAAEVAKQLPDLTRLRVAEWARHYGLALAMWAVVLLGRLLSHPDASKRPATAHYADRPLRKWRGWCGEMKPDELPAETRDSVLAGIEADVKAQTRQCGSQAGIRSPAMFDPAALLARMRAIGWRLADLGDGQVKWEQIPDCGACDWGRIHSELRELVNTHRAQLKACVLKQPGKAVPHAGT